MANARNERKKRSRLAKASAKAAIAGAAAPGTAAAGVFLLSPHVVTEVIALASALSDAPSPEQWPVESQALRAVWERFGTRGKGARVAVIDTGCDPAHPVLPRVMGHDCTASAAGVGDAQGHGTHVCGIVGASGAITGVAPECELHSFRVFTGPSTDDATITRALREINSGAHGHFDVVNMSLGAAVANEEMRLVVLELSARGTLIVCAAGNEGDHTGGAAPRFGTVAYPAEFTSAICVGSADRHRRRSAYSSTGPHMHVMAPGQDVLSAWPGGMLATLSGTSMAAPFVTGMLALMAARCRDRGWDAPDQAEALYCLAASARDMEAPGFDPFTGFGHVDAAGAMERLDSLREPASKTPVPLLVGARQAELASPPPVPLLVGARQAELASPPPVPLLVGARQVEPANAEAAEATDFVFV